MTGGSCRRHRGEDLGYLCRGQRPRLALDRDLTVNVGLRFFHTDQTVTSPVQVASGLVDQTMNAKYDDILPSTNVTYDLAENITLRASASRTMTRADAGLLLPGTTFSDTLGPDRQRRQSGPEALHVQQHRHRRRVLHRQARLVGVAFFRKDVDGFTANTQTTVPFTSLGINFADLNSLAAAGPLNLRGGPNGVATVTLNRPVNLNKLLIQGVEVTWVQPLDFPWCMARASRPMSAAWSRASGRRPGGHRRRPWRYNLQGFYEGHGASLSVNYVWNDESIAANAPQNNVNVPLKAAARGQLDVSAGYQLPFMDKAWRPDAGRPEHHQRSPLRTTFGYDNAPYSVYYPGRQVLLGLRASF